jgi:hypothetical protein
MDELVKAHEALPANEAANIGNAANEDAGFEKLLKFKKGHYESDGEEVPLGTQFVAHCVGWTKCWIKFLDGNVADRKMYRVAEGHRPPEREELDAKDMIGVKDPRSGLSLDPWVYQYLLPLENEAGDLVVFVTSSMGGKRAVADLCKSYSRRAQRTHTSEQPVIKLGSGIMPSKLFGDVPRPQFDVIGWDSSNKEGIREVRPPETLRQEMDDEIPF